MATIPLKISGSGSAPKSNGLLLVRYRTSENFIRIRRQLLDLSAKFVRRISDCVLVRLTYLLTYLLNCLDPAMLKSDKIPSRKSWIRIMIWITTKILSFVASFAFRSFTEFHQHSSTTIRVIPLTDKQKQKHNLLDGGNYRISFQTGELTASTFLCVSTKVLDAVLRRQDIECPR